MRIPRIVPNDAIRVNGKELGASVVGEGGNLGMTQLGRVEYSMHGGRCLYGFYRQFRWSGLF